MNLMTRQLDLDPTHRSGRCVTDGQEPDQTCRLPDSWEWAVFGKGSNSLMVRDRIPRFHENSMKTAVSSGIALPYRQTTNTYQCP